MQVDYNQLIRLQIPSVVVETNLPYPKYRGKVRDTYDLGKELLIVTTDRVSAFDRSLANIPFKGQVLNQISAWWFEHTRHIIPNHMLKMPALNQMQVKKCKVFPVEVIVRGFMTGTTNTAIWTLYQQGDREFFGHQLPDGLTKNHALPHPIITPTTKSDVHDEPLTVEGLAQMDFPSKEQWDFIAEKALKLFEFGQKAALERGLILVDTKYEFGLDDAGNIILIDECHTPDSSRYWLADSYQERIKAGCEPDNFDKEMLRLWYRENSDPYNDEVLPEAPESIVVKLSRRYIQIFEMLTGKQFF